MKFPFGLPALPSVDFSDPVLALAMVSVLGVAGVTLLLTAVFGAKAMNGKKKGHTTASG